MRAETRRRRGAALPAVLGAALLAMLLAGCSPSSPSAHGRGRSGRSAAPTTAPASTSSTATPSSTLPPVSTSGPLQAGTPIAIPFSA
ncbi:MAG TPA: hypothetical protein VEH82_04455, partial [Acidimicrobiales bacterium]|nr:hypothetical protein [Acidimicrobiales bacterium]